MLLCSTINSGIGRFDNRALDMTTSSFEFVVHNCVDSVALDSLVRKTSKLTINSRSVSRFDSKTLSSEFVLNL